MSLKMRPKDWLRLHEGALEKVNSGQRPGQAYANALWEVDEDLYRIIKNTDIDPFHDDKILPQFFLTLSSYENS